MKVKGILLSACMQAMIIISALCQQKELKVGDTLPKELMLDSILNHTVSKQHLSKFYQNKLLIIDFFATWCGSCVKSVQHFNQLKEEFGDQIEIVIVTDESKSKVSNFFSKTASVKNNRLPIIYSDTILHKIFKHRIIPHEIWISKEGNVLAITSHLEVTAENIRKMINAENISLKTKNDQLNFNPKAPLLIGGNGGAEDDFLFRSLLTRRIRGTNAGSSRDYDLDGKIKRIMCLNLSVANLYSIAFSKGRQIIFNKNIIGYSSIDSADYIFPSKASDEWREKNLFCYELILDQYTSPENFYKYMLDDLNRFFPVIGVPGRKEVNCYILKKMSANNKIERSSGSEKIFKFTSDEFFIQNQHISKLFEFIALFDFTPIQDETNIDYPIDLKLKFDFNFKQPLNLESINRALLPYNLILEKTSRKIDILYLKDRDSIYN